MSKKYKFKSDAVVTFEDGKMILDTNGQRLVVAMGMGGNEDYLKRNHLTPIREKLTPLQAAERLLNGESVCSESGGYFSFINTAPTLKALRDEAWYLPEDEEE